MDYDKYANYQLGDFLEDDSFVQWVINPDAENEFLWKTFIEKYPDKSSIVQQASSLILTYRLQESIENDKSKKALWSKIEQSVSASDNQKTGK